MEDFLVQIKGKRTPKEIKEVREHLKGRIEYITKHYDVLEQLKDRNDFDDWGMEEIKKFEKMFHNQRVPAYLKDIRAKVASRKKAIEQELITKKAFSKFLPKICILHEFMVGLPGAMERVYASEEFAYAKALAEECGETTDIVNSVHRILGTTLFDVPVVPLGLESTSCVEALSRDSNFKKVQEHFFPRGTAAGPALLNFLMSPRAADRKNFITLLFTFCQIVYTTAKENCSDLKEHQKLENFISPKDSYDKAGIKLIRTCVYTPPRVWVKLFEYYDMEIPEPYDFGAVVVGDATL